MSQQQTKQVNTQEAKTQLKKINIQGKVVNCKAPRDVNLKSGGTSKLMEAELEDSAGRITLKLWGDQVQKVKDGSTVAIKNGWVSEWKGQQSLSVGSYGELVVLAY